MIILDLDYAYYYLSKYMYCTVSIGWDENNLVLKYKVLSKASITSTRKYRNGSEIGIQI